MVTNTDGDVVSPFTMGAQISIESTIEITFTNPDGSEVSLLTDVVFESIDQLSSSTLLWDKELFPVLIASPVAEASFEEIEASMQTLFAQSFSGSTTTLIVAESALAAAVG